MNQVKLKTILNDPDFERLQAYARDEQADAIAELMAQYHPAQQAKLIEYLEGADRNTVIASLDGRFPPRILVEIDRALRVDLVQTLGTESVCKALMALDTDDAVELLEALPTATAQTILDGLGYDERIRIQQHLEYPAFSAGRLMQPLQIRVQIDWTVAETIQAIRQYARQNDQLYTIYALSPSGKPLAEISSFGLLRAAADAPLRSVSGPVTDEIKVDTDQEQVAMAFRQQNLLSAPVTDLNGKLVGIITVDDVIDVIDEEATEDFLSFASLNGDDLYRAVFATVRSRFAWLSINLATALLVSILIGQFEVTLSQLVAVAVLMPIVASMAGNAGTQTMAITIRALAMDQLNRQGARRLIGKELLVGTVNGLAFACLTGVIAALWFDDPLLGLALGLALVLSLTAAGLFGAAIPLLLKKLGIDPAVASTVLITTVTDVFGFVSFLAIASLIII